MKLKIKKKTAIITGAILLSAAGIFLFTRGGQGPSIQMVQSMELSPMTLSNTVGVTGTVESVDSVNVYAAGTGTIDTVNVKVGDRVKAGDLLGQLDTEALEMSLAQKQASLNSAQRTAQHQLAMSQKAYNRAKSNLENDLNAQVSTTENALKSAELALNNAKKDYEDAKRDLENGDNLSVKQAENSIESAKDNMADAKRAYKDAMDAAEELRDSYDNEIDLYKDAFYEAEKLYKNYLKENPDIGEQIEAARQKKVNAENALSNLNIEFGDNPDIMTPEEYARKRIQLEEELKIAQEEHQTISSVHTSLYNDVQASSQLYQEVLAKADQVDIQARQAMQQAKNTYQSTKSGFDSLQDNYDMAVKTAEKEIERLQAAYDNAKLAYDNAVAQTKTTNNSVGQELDTYLDNIEASKLAADTTVQQLDIQNTQKQLADALITAPIDGTVTAVYAKEGGVSTGVLFVIENTEALKVSTRIKEYDITSVQTGMKTVIKSDATGDAEYAGKVSEISPVAVKNPDGSNNTGTNVEFDAEVSVDTQDTLLRIGMNTRLTIVVEEKEGVLAVPYDAVVTKPDGSTVVFTAVPDETAKDADSGLMLLREIPVTTGMETDFYMEISGEGIQEGVSIITNAQGLTDGQQVQMAPEGGMGMGMGANAGMGMAAAGIL